MSEGRARRSAAGVLFVGPGSGVPVVRLNGEHTTIAARAGDTAGAYAVRMNSAPPGFAAVPMHIHLHAEEAFCVLAGELAVHTSDQVIAAPAGSFVLIERGTAHAISNPGTEPVR
jgi:quercetin dioxygenase-like cupin family protein